MKDFKGRVAVITGGASGIGLAIAEALRAEGAKIVLADVEAAALEAAVAGLGGPSDEVFGVVTDVSKEESVAALADRVFEAFGACHLLFNNAGVGAPSASIWETTINDWKWVHGVNVMGVVHGVLAFVPRMIESGEEGHVINTSSGDGGISPLPDQSVYASSKAAVSILTECLAAQLAASDSKLAASLFYPAGGLLDTGIWTCDRNRPDELARETPVEGEPQTFEKFTKLAKEAGFDLPIQPLDQLAAHLLDGIREEKPIIMIGLEGAVETLRGRAERVAKGQLPIEPSRGLMN
jgi:NAD(P)-dependent dehydrogenase (short-subunit alcohol dehydrogenase family)